MNTFRLRIATPEGLMFDGEASRLLVRAKGGDVGIMANHIDYAASVGTGMVRISLDDGGVKTAACSGGILSIKNKTTRLIADTFEW
ncbi:MAG: F0F1 ATP synthase subunit epsilon, partial [Firmicutes bacterium]|nr:F0F1 ATP synthase subunit epsilon [Bacillota bacterium]